LKGTLTEPFKHSNKYPVVLLIAGSGPTDRNGNNSLMKNDALLQIAQQLASYGIASVRYDKRAIAESALPNLKEQDLRFDDYVNDAAAWIDTLARINRFSKIIVAGHSEGALIGMAALNRKATPGIRFISIAGAGRSADVVLKEQLSTQPKPIANHSFGIIDTLKMGLHPSVVNPMVLSLFRPSVQPYLISWFQYNPVKIMDSLMQKKIPVLILQGTNDLQITVEDAAALQSAYPAASLKFITNMNHVLRIVEGSKNANLATYYKANPPISEELLMTMKKFIFEKKRIK
jgi:pimeloyl-ACP methyl ester carboxylesterase